jgi:hypothetical protein
LVQSISTHGLDSLVDFHKGGNGHNRLLSCSALFAEIFNSIQSVKKLGPIFCCLVSLT